MWKKVNTWAIGGLREIGFHNNSDVLMVLSSNGRGIFNCITGEKIAQDPDDYYSHNWQYQSGIVEGFGPLEGIQILCGGFEHENILKQKTCDGWHVTIENENRVDWENKLKKASVMYIQNEKGQKLEINVFHYGIDRGYGFSDTGRSFVIGRSDAILIWTR